ncbi:MAG: hypothetical protein HC771_24880 [Synechococcales cyanobacterium CRU_2_2]|nr:hypothetical protein [Synechococcales cyanobacterium CRU_2_2]
MTPLTAEDLGLPAKAEAPASPSGESSAADKSAADQSGAGTAKDADGEAKEDTAAKATQTASPGLVSAEPLKDSNVLDRLNVELYDNVNKGWTESIEGNGDLEYRVQLSPDGEVVGFEPLNQAARDYGGELPLAKLKQSGNPSQVAEFKVVFKASDVLEVSPWEGF